MFATRYALPVLAGAGLLMAGVGATPAQASSPVCQLRVLSIQALDIDDDPRPTDEISLRLGGTPTVERTYTAGQTRDVLGDGSRIFSGSVNLKLVERDGGTREVLATQSVPCSTHQVQRTLHDPGFDAIYQVLYRVDVL